jgi:hypothetical protein
MQAGLPRYRAALALALAAVLSACAHSPSAEPAEIFVLMGQSNMSGRGVLAEAPPGYGAPDPGIRLYGNDGQWRPAVDPLDSAVGQVDPVSADVTIAAVGPARSFADALLARNPARRIVFVPCAKGGSSITQWAPSTDRSTLYGSCLARVREAAPAGRVAGLLWYQGEADAEDVARAAAWAADFTRVVQSFRTDIGAPDARVLVVGLSDMPTTGQYAGRYPAWTAVQDAQRTLPLAGAVHVTAMGLPKNSDQLHLSTAGQIALGRRMADAW